MADKSLRFVVSAVDKNAGKVLGDVATHGESASKRLGSSFAKLGSTVGTVLGGEVGDVVDKVSSSFDKLGESGGAKLGEKIAIGGAALTGIGATLTMMGSAEKQATDQLGQSIANTGHSIEEFEKPIEATVGRMENFGYTAVQTKGALQALTDATHDPAKALSLMGEAADLAASKHISLESAAAMLGKVLEGKGTRVLTAYGVQIQKNADGTSNWNATNALLAKQLNGQASAAADNFGGKLKALTAKVEDSVSEFGQKWGPSITAAGVVMTVVGPAFKAGASLVGKIGDAFHSSGAAATAGADAHEAASTRVATSAATSSATVVASEETAMGAEETSASSSTETAATHAASSAAVGDAATQSSAAVVSAEAQAMAAEETSANASTSAAAQHGAAAAVVGESATGAAGEVSAADAQIVAANEAAAGSNEALAVSSARSRVSMLGGVGVMAAVAAGTYMLGKQIATATEKGNSFAHWIDDGYGQLGKLDTALVNNADHMNDVGRQWAEGQLKATGLADKAAKSGITIEQMTTAIMGGSSATSALSAEWKKAGAPAGATIAMLHVLQQQYQFARTGADELRDKTDKEAASHLKLVTALEVQAGSMGVTTDAYKTAQGAIDKATASEAANTLQMQLENDAAGLLKQGLDALNDKTLSAAEAGDRFKDSTVAINDVMKQNGRTLDDNTVKGRANRAAVYSSIEAAQAHAQAVGKQTGSTEAATKAYQGDIAALKAHLIHLGYDKDAVNAIIKTYAQMPTVKKTRVDVIDDATAKIGGIETELYNLTHRHYQVTVDAAGGYDYRTGSVRFNAGGTDFSPGGRTMVAERETEIIEPRGAKVTPMSQLRFGGGAAQTVNININVSGASLVAPDRRIGEELARHLTMFLGRPLGRV